MTLASTLETLGANDVVINGHADSFHDYLELRPAGVGIYRHNFFSASKS